MSEHAPTAVVVIVRTSRLIRNKPPPIDALIFVATAALVLNAMPILSLREAVFCSDLARVCTCIAQHQPLNDRAPYPLIMALSGLEPAYGPTFTPHELEMMPARLEIVRALVHAGANVYVVGDDNWLPLTYAAHCQREDIVRLLMSAGACPYAKAGQAIKIAAAKESRACMNMLVDYICRVPWSMRHGADALAADASSVEAPDALEADALEADARVAEAAREACLGHVPASLRVMDARKSAQSILFVAAQIAARAGRVHHLADLMERGFNMNQLASDGSLLHAAVRARTSTSVSYLLEVGCNVDARDRVARTPLHYAARNNDTACVELLLRAGATRWLTDVDGSTALDLAVKSESTGVVRQLLATGVTHAAPMQTCWF